MTFNWGWIIERISIKKLDNKYLHVFGKNIDWSLIPTGYPACQLFDLAKYIDLKKYTPQTVVFILRKIENLGFSLKIEDNMKNLKKRSLRSQSQDYEGPIIDLENLNDTGDFRYFLGISQTKNLETYSEIECKNYPNKNFLSYQACDESFVYNKMKDSNIMPFWAAQELYEITNFT